MAEEARTGTVSPLLWISVGLGYAVAAAIFVLRIFASDLPASMELPGAIALAAVAALPPTLALLGLTGRPTLLLPAGVAAVTSVPVLSLLGVIMAVLGIMWLIAYGTLRRPGSILTTVVATIIVWMLWVAAAAALFIHLDPRCAQTLTDGTVREIDAEAIGYESGWVWDSSSTISVSSSGSGDVETEVCTSDLVTGGEALATVALVGTSLGSGWLLTRSEAEG